MIPVEVGFFLLGVHTLIAMIESIQDMDAAERNPHGGDAGKEGRKKRV